MMWLDRARAELPRQAKVVGFLDSAYYIDLPALPASKFMGFADQTKAFANNFNASGVVDAAVDFETGRAVVTAAADWGFDAGAIAALLDRDGYELI